MPKKKKQIPLEEEQQNLEELEAETESSELDEPSKELEQVEQKEPTEIDEAPPEPKEDAGMKEAIEAKKSIEEKMKSLERLQTGKELLQSAKDSRRKFDRDWLSRDLFRRGYQFVNQSSTGTLSLTSSSRARVPVNLTWAYMRSIRNQVTSFNPKWEVLPEYKGKMSEQDARLSGKLLDYVFKLNNMNKKIKEAVTQGLTYSVGGPFECYWDPNFDNGESQPKGNVIIILHDPYDIYVDPDCTELADARFLVKAVRTSVKAIKADERYDENVREKLTGGASKKAESEYKQFLIQATQQSSTLGSLDNEYTIKYELQLKEDVGQNVKIRYLVWTDEVDEPLLDELRDEEDFNMESFQADMNPLEYYGESWSKHVIALNRVLNALESSVFEYNYKFAKGRIVIDKNSGVNIVTNEHGSIIEKNPGSTVASLPLASLPPQVENQIIRIRSMMEDISGVHEASLGRVPSSVKSGIGIAELKQSDSTNQDDLVQNLEQCLMRLGKKVLKLIAANYTIPRIVKVVGTGRVVEHFAVVGSNYVPEEKTNWKIKNENYPLAHIKSNNELDVQIGSWLAYSKEAQRETLVDMSKAGLIDQETVLKYLEFPNIQDVIDATRAEKIIESKRTEESGLPSGITQEQLALSENELMSEGTPQFVDAIEDDHELHIAIHNKVLSNDNSGNNLVAGHIREHRIAQKGGGQDLSMQQTQQPQQGMAQVPTPPSPQMAQPGQGQVVNNRPPESYFSAGIQELPPTAGGIIGSPVGSIPMPGL